MRIFSKDCLCPKLEELINELHQDKDKSKLRIVENFWNTIKSSGSPLIDPFPVDKRFYLVTFVYQSTKKLENVFLLTNLNEVDPLRYIFEQIPHTDIYFIAFKMTKRVRTSYRIIEDDPLVSIYAGQKYGLRLDKLSSNPDPLNKNVIIYKNGISEGVDYLEAVVELPEAPKQLWLNHVGSDQKGNLIQFNNFNSTILHNSRSVLVYIPKSIPDEDEKYNLLIQFDKEEYEGPIQLPTILDNLILSKKIGPTICVFIGNSVDENSESNRNIELTCNPDFKDFIVHEIVPWLRNNYNVTNDPAKTVISGSSFGGLSALYIAFNHEDIFGNVLSQSGSFWFNHPSKPEQFEWLIREIGLSSKKELKIYIEVGTLEGEYSSDNPFFPHMILANRHLCTILDIKKYEYKYHEFEGGHLAINWKGTIGDALVYLIGE